MKAYVENVGPKNPTCSLVSSVPPNLDVFYPSTLQEDTRNNIKIKRNPMPATWLIATTKGERGNIYNFRKMLKGQVGGIDNKRISRFGKNKFLINAKSPVQAAMLLNLRIEPEGILK